ncbi:MAG: tetratricopeptide repeat protein [Elusimicrobia bacterium]|nr:tetratricopeptide repeat protein [Elusimicrobiota bacterium]
MENEVLQKILVELQEHNQFGKKAYRIIFVLIPILVLVWIGRILLVVKDIKHTKKETIINYSKNINYYQDTVEFDKAIEESKKFVEKAPDYYYAWALLGWSYFYKGDLVEAKKSIEKSLQLFPDYESGQKVLKSINSRLAQKNKYLKKA